MTTPDPDTTTPYSADEATIAALSEQITTAVTAYERVRAKALDELEARHKAERDALTKELDTERDALRKRVGALKTERKERERMVKRLRAKAVGT